MKKWFVSLLVFSMVASLVGCGQKQEEQKKDPVVQEQKPEGEKEPDNEGAKAPELVELTLYLPNSNADGFDIVEEKVENVDESAIVEKLIEKGVLPEGTVANQFQKTDEQLQLDLNKPFLEKLSGTGTAGEYMLMGSVVNTFLKAFDAQKIVVTVDGEIPETGHTIYDAPQEIFE